MIVIGFLLAVAGLSAAQVYTFVQPVPIQVPVFQYPGIQYPVGYNQGYGQVGTQGFASRFGESGNSVGTYAFSSPGTGPVGGTYSSTNQVINHHF